MSWLYGFVLVLTAYKGSFVRPLVSAEDTQFDYFNSDLEALYPWAPLTISDNVKMASDYRGAFPFDVYDPRKVLRSHPQPLQADIYSLLKPGLEGLRQPVREDLYESERENSQQPTQRDPFKAKELQQPANMDLLQTGKEGLLEHTREGVEEPVKEELQKGELWALESVMWACHQLLQYFDDHLTQMNFDAVVGTHIAEAQFRVVSKALTKEMKTAYLTGESVVEAQVGVEGLWSLTQEAGRVSTMAKTFIMKADPDYYRELGALVNAGFWDVPLTIRALNTTPLVPPHNPSAVLHGEEQLVERQSDECIAEELGDVYGGRGDAARRGDRTRRGDGARRESMECAVSLACWQRMTAQGYSGYSLTHQVFYLIIGLQAGCGQQLEEMASRGAASGNGGLQGSVEHIMDHLCAAVLQEATTISQADFPEHRRDLFMEQGALCGIFGYRDFFRKEWLAEVLSWQQDSGCFGTSPVYLTTPQSHERVRREERPMAGNCLAHRSAVALGYLSLFVRFLAMDLLL